MFPLFKSYLTFKIFCYIFTTLKMLHTKFLEWNNYVLPMLLWYWLTDMKCQFWMINWKVYGREQSWPVLSYYPSIFLEKLRKIMKNASHPIHSAGWDSIWNLPNMKQLNAKFRFFDIMIFQNSSQNNEWTLFSLQW